MSKSKTLSAAAQRLAALTKNHTAALVGREFKAGVTPAAAALAAKGLLSIALTKTNTAWAASLVQGVLSTNCGANHALVTTFAVGAMPSVINMQSWQASLKQAQDIHAAARAAAGKKTAPCYARAQLAIDAIQLSLDTITVKQAARAAIAAAADAAIAAAADAAIAAAADAAIVAASKTRGKKPVAA